MPVKGQCEIHEIRPSSEEDKISIITYRHSEPMDPDWDLIIPVNGSRYTELLFYKKSSGKASLYNVTDSGTLFCRVSGNIGKDWDIIVYGKFLPPENSVSLFCYNKDTGKSAFLIPDNSEENFSVHTTLNLTPRIRQIVAGNFFNSRTYDDILLNDGGSIDLLTTDGSGTLKQKNSLYFIDNKWDIIISLNFSPGKGSDLLLYDRSKGEVFFYINKGNGIFEKGYSSSSWGNIDIIVPGFFSGTGKIDIMRYTRRSMFGASAYFLSISSDGTPQLIPSKFYQKIRNSWKIILSGHFKTNYHEDNPSELLLYDDQRVLISNTQVRELIKNKLQESFYTTAYIRTPDDLYYCTSMEDIKHIISQNSVDSMGYIEQKHDCDDFALRLKCAFIEDAYSNNERRYPHCVGILHGGHIRSPDGSRYGDHAVNMAITNEWELIFIEPQTDAIFNPTDNDNQIDFIYV